MNANRWLALSVLFLCASVASLTRSANAGDREPYRASVELCTFQQWVSSHTAVQFAPAHAISKCSTASAAQAETLCLINEDSTATYEVLIASHQVVLAGRETAGWDTDAVGWPVKGGEKECYDIGPNTVVWVYRKSTQNTSSDTVKGILLK